MSQLLESPSSTVTLPKPDAAPAPPPHRSPRRLPQPPQREHERDVEVETGDATDARKNGVPDSQATEPSSHRRSLPRADEAGLSRQERRRRLELLVFRLADTPEFTSRLPIYERHTMRELSAAAALRPDLMPILNGEFEHVAFFAP
jgi:hypothetical protein